MSFLSGLWRAVPTEGRLAILLYSLKKIVVSAMENRVTATSSTKTQICSKALSRDNVDGSEGDCSVDEGSGGAADAGMIVSDNRDGAEYECKGSTNEAS